MTWSLGAGGAFVQPFDTNATEAGIGIMSVAGSVGGFLSPRASFGARIDTTYGRTTGGRGLFVFTIGPTAELWATERLLFGAGMSLLVVGIEPYDILLSRGMALPLRTSVRPFAESGFRITLGVAPAIFRERAVLLHATLLAEWQSW